MKTLSTLLLIILATGNAAFAQGIPDPLEQQPSDNIGFVQNVGQVSDENGNSLTTEHGLYFHSVSTFPPSYYFDSKMSFVFQKLDTIYIDDTTTSIVDTLRRLDMSWHWSDVGNSVEPSSFEQVDDELYNYYFPHCASGCDQLYKNRGLLYENIYDGVDMRVYSNGTWIKIYFVVAPGTNPDVIRLNFEGHDSINVNPYLMTVTLANQNIYLPSGVAYEYGVSGGPTLLNWLPEFDLQLDGSVQLSDGGNSYDKQKTLVFEISLPLAAGSADLKNINKSIVDPAIIGTYWDIDHDGSGNSYLSGYTRSSPVVPTNAYITKGHGEAEIIVDKRKAADLSRAWLTMIGGNLDDGETWFGISLDNEGNTFISANTHSTDLASSSPSVLKTLSGAYWDNSNTSSRSDGDAVDQIIVKLNTNGERTWATLFGGDETDDNNDRWSGDIIVDKSDNSLYMGARDDLSSTEVTQPAGNGDYLNHTYGAGQCYIVKFNGSTLDREWCTYYGGLQTYVTNFAIDDNNNILMTGYSGDGLSGRHSGEMYSLPFQGGGSSPIMYDGFVSRFDTDWNMDWETYVGGRSNDYSRRININNSGVITIAGNTLSDGGSGSVFPLLDNGITHYGTYFGTGSSWPRDNIEGDAFVTTFGSTLEMINSTFLGGANGEAAFGLASNSSTNDLYVMGSTASNGMPSANNQPSFLYSASYNGSSPPYSENFISGFSTDFELNWSTYFGSTGIDYLYSASYFAPYLYIVGKTNDVLGVPYTGFPTNPTQTGFTGGAYITRFHMGSFPLAVKELSNNSTKNEVGIYPNPSKSLIHISSSEGKIDLIRMYDVAGSLVKKSTFDHETESMDISDLAKGIYFIEIIHEEGNSSVGKFIKE